MNWRGIMRTFALLVAVLAVSILPVAAEEDAVAGQAIIRSQEEAFTRDDAAAAFTLAAPGIKSEFQTPDIFMSMVRNGYAPVYRHRSFEFGEAKTYEGKIYQQVHIIDASGDAWEALYTLEPQPDGTFKISRCVLKKAVTS
jgi:Domain of unknown function (DUF4864)